MVEDAHRRRRRREPGGTSTRRPRPWPRRRQRRRIMRREQPCDHERPHRPGCGTFKAQPPRRLPPRSCTKHACRSHRCFCTDASPGQLQSMLFALTRRRGSSNHTNLRLHRVQLSQCFYISRHIPGQPTHQRNIRAPHKAPGAARSRWRSLRGLVAARMCARVRRASVETDTRFISRSRGWQKA